MLNNNQKQHGAILFISLIILLLITLVAIGSTKLSTSGQRIAFNFQLQNTTFQAAESALDETVRLLEESEFEVRQVLASPAGRTRNATFTDSNGFEVRTTTLTTFTENLYTGGSIGKSRSLIFKIISTASVNGFNAVTELEHGFQVRVVED